MKKTKNTYKIVGGGLAHLKSRIEEVISLLNEVDKVENKDDEQNFIFLNLLDNLNRKGSEWVKDLNKQVQNAQKLFYFTELERNKNGSVLENR